MGEEGSSLQGERAGESGSKGNTFQKRHRQDGDLRSFPGQKERKGGKKKEKRMGGGKGGGRIVRLGGGKSSLKD